MDDLFWAVGGIGFLLFVKYIAIGLNYWDDILHPGRTEPPNLERFKYPLLGLFSSGRDKNPWPR
jgi:hypothetical protein